jgi:hypothetical protein
MRGRSSFLVLISLMLLFAFCGKKNDKGTNTGDNGSNGDNGSEVIPDWKFFKFADHGVLTQIPNFVNILFQVSGPGGKAAWFLKPDRFLIKENDVPLNPATSLLQVRKKNNISYELKTVLLLDNNAGTSLDSLKAAARQFVIKITTKQTIALYTFADEPVRILGFTSDVNALTAAIDAVQPGAAASDLYGAVIAGTGACEEKYELNKVVQGAVVVLADGPDTRGARTLEEAAEAAAGMQVVALGAGAADSTALKEIAKGGFTFATGSFVDKAAGLADEIAHYSQSFYVLNYMSTLRGFATQSLKITVVDNENTGDGSLLQGEFRSSYFENPGAQGLYVNYSKGKPAGIDSLTLMVTDTTTVSAFTMSGMNPPDYAWSTDNGAVIRVEEDAFDGAKAFIMGVGQIGQIANITVTDQANDMTKTVGCRLVKYETFTVGGILLEVYNGTTGTTIADLRKFKNFPDHPSTSRLLPSYDKLPIDAADNYGSRIRGFLQAPESGEYTFWIASDDASELWLSTNTDSTHISKIAWVSAWTGHAEWTKEPNQKSNPVYLSAGNFYYIESVMIEGSGGDSHAVAWQGPGIPTRTIIAGEYIAPPINKMHINKIRDNKIHIGK